MPAQARKSDSAAIRTFMTDLGGQEWLSGRRSWWPRYLFHHTDVRNAAQILHENRLFCRQMLESRTDSFIDSGSADVLQNTAEWVANYVRLYFRPRTPTQYRSEGVRPLDRIEMQAHCPVPIFFLFDSAEVLTMDETLFSDGNLAAVSPAVGSDVEFLSNLNFHKIYHVGWHDNDHSITYSRNAEVIVKTSLSLHGLRWVLTRSEAERETLLSLLNATAQRNWQERIRVDNKLELFERRWTFVERVQLDSDVASLHFSPDTQGPGPFLLHIDIIDLGTSAAYVYDEAAFYSRPVFRLSIPEELASYRLTATLDGHLVYQNDRFDDPPF